MKKLLALMLAALMVVSMMTGCSKSGAQDDGAQEAAVEVTAEDKGTVTVWVAEAVVDFTKSQIEAFKTANPNYAGFTFNVEAVGEGDATNNMVTDVEGGADLFGFAQDQLARLVAAGAVAPVTGANLEAVKANNDAGSVGAATMGDVVYAYPMTSDNGYFLYYDKSVVTDPSTLEAILADCEKAGKGLYFQINSGWYQTAFFFGTGCKLEYTTDNEGNFSGSNITYDSPEGLAALKAMIALHKSPAFYNGSSVPEAANAAAVVSGTWDSGAAQDLFGENYATAKLPTFSVDGKTYQFSGFGGFKLMGVKPQTDAKKLQVVNALAAYLTSEEVQLARFNAVGWGPSNLNAQKDPAIANDPALSALAAQLAYTIPQGQYPDNYWTLATSLGDSVISKEYDNATDDQLNEVLKTFADTCRSYAQ